MKKWEFVLTEYPVKDTRDLNGRHPRTLRPLKLFLIDKIGICWWCKRKVKDYPYMDHVEQPDDAASIDHLKEKPFRQKGEMVGKVLACYRCNQRRAEAHTRELLRLKRNEAPKSTP